MSDEYESCERCGRDATFEDIETVELDSSWDICYGCVQALEEDIEFNDWTDRYTEEDHEKAVEKLSSYDEVECVISKYESGAIFVHTPYVSADVVVDVCRHYGFRITDFHPVWAQESELPCIADHGSTFEIVLKYLPDSPMPSPADVKFTDNRIDDLVQTDKQF